MKHSDNQYVDAMAKCGFFVTGDFKRDQVTISHTPIQCIDEDGNIHTHTNGVNWSIVREGLKTVRGWISDSMRVSRYGSDKNLTGHIVMPFGGSWTHPLETEYQQRRWKAWDAVG
jgi:hypothetical protein